MTSITSPMDKVSCIVGDKGQKVLQNNLAFDLKSSQEDHISPNAIDG